MPDQFRDFIAILAALDKQDVDYVLIGGVAVILHGMERLTRDVDIMVKMAPENIERLRKALHEVFDDASIEEITLGELRKYPVIRYGTPNGFYIDVIARIGEVAAFENVAYEVLNYEGTKIKIATPETLYRLKKDTVRDRDKMDAAFLQELIKARNQNHLDTSD